MNGKLYNEGFVIWVSIKMAADNTESSGAINGAANLGDMRVATVDTGGRRGSVTRA